MNSERQQPEVKKGSVCKVGEASTRCSRSVRTFNSTASPWQMRMIRIGVRIDMVKSIGGFATQILVDERHRRTVAECTGRPIRTDESLRRSTKGEVEDSRNPSHAHGKSTKTSIILSHHASIQA
jgi:hypothetical protein